MKFWVYSIDWRSMAVMVVAECKNEREADIAHAKHIAEMSPEQLVDMAQFKTIATTAVSPEMVSDGEQFNRLGGRAVA